MEIFTNFPVDSGAGSPNIRRHMSKDEPDTRNKTDAKVIVEVVFSIEEFKHLLEQAADLGVSPEEIVRKAARALLD